MFCLTIEVCIIFCLAKMCQNVPLWCVTAGSSHIPRSRGSNDLISLDSVTIPWNLSISWLMLVTLPEVEEYCGWIPINSCSMQTDNPMHVGWFNPLIYWWIQIYIYIYNYIYTHVFSTILYGMMIFVCLDWLRSQSSSHAVSHAIDEVPICCLVKFDNSHCGKSPWKRYLTINIKINQHMSILQLRKYDCPLKGCHIRIYIYINNHNTILIQYTYNIAQDPNYS